ncbi:MAG TPA: hypothetical protein VHO72_11675, partial [Bacteroidales bacterium]|nr:hypothetical protein [Bacteroidales bacterium]
MAFLMLVTAIDLLFDRKPFTIQLNKIDLALLAFFTYYTIRAATTPYMPLLQNQRWINWGLCVVLYFVIKRIINSEELKSKVNSEELIVNSENQALPGNHKPTINYLTFNLLTNNIPSLIISFLILTALCQSLWGLLQLYGFLPSFNGYFKITGTFFNPAPYAMYLAVIFPMALAKILYHKKLKVKSEEDKVKSEELIVNSENHTHSANHKPTINFLTFNYSLFSTIHFSLLTYYLSFATIL